jgi:cold shock CspA family protein
MTGKIISYSPDRGKGLIWSDNPDDVVRSIRFDKSAITESWVPVKGQHVQYDTTERGLPQATRVRLLDVQP